MTLTLAAGLALWLPAAGAAAAQRDAAPYSIAVDTVITVRPDRTAERVTTTRVTIHRETALQSAGKQFLTYNEGMETLEIVEAYTEKPDGTKVRVDPANIISGDASAGNALIYYREAKARTIIFPDLAVGDAVVYTTRTDVRSRPLAGHYYDSRVFARALPFATSTVQVVAPKGLPLKVAVYGPELERQIVEDGDTTRHVISYHPGARIFAEPGETAASDRDPRILISTFADYEEIGRAYWAAAAARTAVTPEIAALADRITDGIDDKRAQAAAIDRWVKRNIRYIADYVGAGGWVPHDAASVLRNKYGDCKDHVTLMSALLAAKGIASEHVIINLGNMHALPETPVPSFNHLILYLPDFGIYNDPTNSRAALGVLAPGAYDKIVVHASANGARVARTPPMRAADHTMTNRTRIMIAADGTVTGETTEIATGFYAANARAAVLSIQDDGPERAAEIKLRSIGTPGKGRFEVAATEERGEPFVTKSSFTVKERATISPGGTWATPVGLTTHGTRPGAVLLNARHEDRKVPFVCWAGRQIEEIDVTFAEGLPLPELLKSERVENRHLTFSADYQLEDRTLKIRREFVSRVRSQVCAPESEAEIAGALRTVQRILAARLKFPTVSAANPPPPPMPERQVRAELIPANPGAVPMMQ